MQKHYLRILSRIPKIVFSINLSLKFIIDQLMKKILRSLFFAYVLLHITVLTCAQKINWNSAPRKGIVFEISNKDAQRLLTKSLPDTIFIGLLRNQIDTFDVQKGWINRPSKGHFVMAKIEGNTLHCEYTSVFPYQVFSLRNTMR